MVSVITGRDRNCAACRAFSGIGLVGVGGYMATIASKNTAPVFKTTLYLIALGFSGLGVARICDWPPFRHA